MTTCHLRNAITFFSKNNLRRIVIDGDDVNMRYGAAACRRVPVVKNRYNNLIGNLRNVDTHSLYVCTLRPIVFVDVSLRKIVGSSADEA